MITMDARRRLEAERRDLLASIARTEAELATPVDDRGEDTTTSQHPADVASDLYAREIALLTDLTLREQVADIDAALARMDNGTYGTCVDCGDGISKQRLEVHPQAARCVACQTREERRV
jgi:RNA polymerase-binding transcription factor DksA